MPVICRWGFLSGNVQAGPNCKLLRVIESHCLERVMALSGTRRGGKQNTGLVQFVNSHLISTSP